MGNHCASLTNTELPKDRLMSYHSPSPERWSIWTEATGELPLAEGLLKTEKAIDREQETWVFAESYEGYGQRDFTQDECRDNIVFAPYWRLRRDMSGELRIFNPRTQKSWRAPILITETTSGTRTIREEGRVIELPFITIDFRTYTPEPLIA
jgi:hypothetical protein